MKGLVIFSKSLLKRLLLLSKIKSQKKLFRRKPLKLTQAKIFHKKIELFFKNISS